MTLPIVPPIPVIRIFNLTYSERLPSTDQVLTCAANETSLGPTGR